MVSSLHLNEKSSEVCIKARSPPVSLTFIGQVTKYTTVKWPIWGNVKKCYGCKREFLPAVPPDHVPTTFLLEQSPIGTGINKA